MRLPTARRRTGDADPTTRERRSPSRLNSTASLADKGSASQPGRSGVNALGVPVWSVQVPAAGELDHDVLWRTTARLPERGRIGVFNRSYYEEVLVVRVHPELLQRQGLPGEVVTPRIWEERYEDIAGFAEQPVERRAVLHAAGEIEAAQHRLQLAVFGECPVEEAQDPGPDCLQLRRKAEDQRPSAGVGDIL